MYKARCTLVEINYENDKKCVLSFLDKNKGEIHEVNFNKQAFKNNKFVDDEAKAEKVEQWCTTIFGVSFDELYLCEGMECDVYVYDNFNSLFEMDMIDKFTADMVGEMYSTKIKEIKVDEYFIRIRYDIDDKTYESKMTFGKYVKSMNKWFVDPQKKDKVYEKFEEKFLVPVERKDELIGHPLMVEVKSAFGENYYGDAKKFSGKRK